MLRLYYSEPLINAIKKLLLLEDFTPDFSKENIEILKNLGLSDERNEIFNLLKQKRNQYSL